MTSARKHGLLAACALTLVVVVAATAVDPATTTAVSRRSKLQRTVQITHGNGPSTNAVISGDRRWARAIAFQSEASNLVRGDTNGLVDVFVVRRRGRFDNRGQMWKPGKIRLLSRGRGGGPAHRNPRGPAGSRGVPPPPQGVALPSHASKLPARPPNRGTDTLPSHISRR